MPRQTEIRQHLDATAAIERNAGQGARDFTGLDPRSPNGDIGRDALVGHLHKTRSHFFDR